MKNMKYGGKLCFAFLMNDEVFLNHHALCRGPRLTLNLKESPSRHILETAGTKIKKDREITFFLKCSGNMASDKNI